MAWSPRSSRPNGRSCDRDRDARDREFRDRADRNREQFHNNSYDLFSRRGPSPRGRDRDRDRDRDRFQDRDRGRDPRMTGSNREPVTGSRFVNDRSSSAMSPRNDASDKASVTSHLSGSETNPGRQAFDQDVRHITDLVCSKLYLFIQREDTTKQRADVQNDLKRSACKQLDFGSVGEILNGQLQQMATKEAKCTSKIDAIERDISSALRTFLDKYAVSALGIPATPTPAAAPSLATAQSLDPKIEQRLVEQQRAAIETARSEMALGLKKFKEEMKSDHEAENKRLMKALEQEREDRKALEENMMELSRNLAKKLDSLSSENARSQALIRETKAAHDNDLAKLASANKELISTATASAAVKAEKAVAEQQRTIDRMQKALDDVKQLESRLLKEEKTSEQLRQELSCIDTRVESLKASVEDMTLPETVLGDLAALAKRVSSHDASLVAQGHKQDTTAYELASLRSIISALPLDQLKNYLTDLSTLKTRVEEAAKAAIDCANANAQAATESLAEASGSSQAEVKHIVTPLVAESEERLRNAVKSMLENMANQFAIFLGTYQDTTSEQSKMLDGKFAQLDKTTEDIETSKAELAKLADKLAEINQQHSNIQASLQQAIRRIEQQFEYAQLHSGASVEDLQMQLADFNTWRSNFTTKSLYKDIVDHVNATIPSGTALQVRRLLERVKALEEWIEDRDAKRRKTPNGTPASVTGGGRATR